MTVTENPFLQFKQPLLACPLEIEKVKLPYLVSPKLDGIRCIMQDGVALSRRLKPIPNRYVQSVLHSLPDGFDGELIVGQPTTDKTNPDDSVMQRTSSGVMSRDGEPDFTYFVFDRFNDQWETEPFKERYSTIHAMCTSGGLPPNVVPLIHWPVDTMAGLIKAEEAVVADGFEGLMLRDPNGRYKQGRSTMIDNILLKMKRFFDAEAVVIGVVEQMRNDNEQERDERGYAKRSKKKAGLVPADTLGALVCRTRLRSDGTIGIEGCETDRWVTFELGGGFTAAQRASLWARRHTDLVGSIHTFKFQELTPDGVPRFPVWKAERNVSIDG